MMPRIEILKEKKLIGQRLKMSFQEYKISELWKKFMPGRNEIPYKLSDELISLAVYKPDFFNEFQPNEEFEKWAAVEVEKVEQIPAEMEYFLLPSGLYAVFEYNGLNTDNSIYKYIFNDWLPNSKYILDNRPHFEILGEKYKNNDPTSEEEIWIPIRDKNPFDFRSKEPS